MCFHSSGNMITFNNCDSPFGPFTSHDPYEGLHCSIWHNKDANLLKTSQQALDSN